MTKYIHEPRGLPVPNSRAGRMARLGGMAAGVAGNMAVEGGRQLLSGQRPRMEDLLLTPQEFKTITALRRRLMNMPPPQLMPMPLFFWLAHRSTWATSAERRAPWKA